MLANPELVHALPFVKMMQDDHMRGETSASQATFVRTVRTMVPIGTGLSRDPETRPRPMLVARRYHRDMSDSTAIPSAVIHASGLTKRFGSFTAVDGVDFDVAPGGAFGFLGPNGAGKTSTMRMIGTVSPISAGTLRVFGLDPARDGARIRARMGVVPQADTLDRELSVLGNLRIYGRSCALSWAGARRRTIELLDFVQLAEGAGDKVEPLSGGMKRRLVIARALINEPSLLLLDEPTTGLDPQARHLVWDRLYRLKARGVTLV